MGPIDNRDEEKGGEEAPPIAEYYLAGSDLYFGSCRNAELFQ